MTSTRNGTDRAAAETLWGKIKGVPVAMTTRLDDNGRLNSRPMATLPHAGFEDGTLWFFTHADADKASEIDRHWRVNLAYANPQTEDYISLSGIAELVRDAKKIQFLWRDPMARWFPQGTDDPEIALLKITVDQAEYWDSPSGAMVHAYGSLTAVSSGDAGDLGEKLKIAFQ